jgi:hypothetical protein
MYRLALIFAILSCMAACAAPDCAAWLYLSYISFCCPLTNLFNSSLCYPGRVCSTAVCSAPGRICICSPGACAVPRYICSTSVCASPGRICSLGACAVPRHICSTAACASPGRVCFYTTPVLPLKISIYSNLRSPWRCLFCAASERVCSTTVCDAPFFLFTSSLCSSLDESAQQHPFVLLSCTAICVVL